MFEPDNLTHLKPLDLYQAAKEGSLVLVQQHIQNNPGLVNESDASGKTALYHAVEMHKLSVVEYLVKEAKADTTIIDIGNGMAAIHIAAMLGFQDVVTYLLNYAPNTLNLLDIHGNTPLKIAAMSKYGEAVVELLIARKADVTRANKHDSLAIHAAAQEDSLKNVELLIAQDENTAIIYDGSGHTPLQLAVANNKMDIVKWWWENRQQDFKIKNIFGHSIENIAAAKDCHQMITYLKTLHQSGAPTGIYAAAAAGNLAEVKSFINAGFYINVRDSNGITALYYAAEQGKLEVVRYLINDAKAATTCLTEKMQETILHAAVRSSHKKTIKFIAENCKNLMSWVDHVGNTPLIFAIITNQYAIVQLFIDHYGADLKSPGKDQWLPLHYAVKFSGLEIIGFLYEKNQEVARIENSSGHTPLQVAALFDGVTVMQWWWGKNRADFARVNSAGQDIFDVAVSDNKVNSVQFLGGVGFLNIQKIKGYLNNHKKTQLSDAMVSLLRNMQSTFKTVQLYSDGADSESKHAAPLLDYAKTAAGLTLNLVLKNGRATFSEVQALIAKEGADIEVVSIIDGFTNLMYAVNHADLDIVAYLINKIKQSASKQINARNDDGNTALMLAAQQGLMEIVKILFHAGKADLKIVNLNGENALMLAINAGLSQLDQKKRMATIQYLAELMPVNYVNPQNGQTALQLAVVQAVQNPGPDGLKIIDILIVAGAIADEKTAQLAQGVNKEMILECLSKGVIVVLTVQPKPAQPQEPRPVESQKKPEIKKDPKTENGSIVVIKKKRRKKNKETSKHASENELQSSFNSSYAKAYAALQYNKYVNASLELKNCNAALAAMERPGLNLKLVTLARFHIRYKQLQKDITGKQHDVSGSSYSLINGVLVAMQDNKHDITMLNKALKHCEETPIVFLNYLANGSFDKETLDNPCIAELIKKISEEFKATNDNGDHKKKYGNILNHMLTGTQIVKNFKRLRKFNLLKIFFPEVDKLYSQPEKVFDLFIKFKALEESDIPNKVHKFQEIINSTLVEDKEDKMVASQPENHTALEVQADFGSGGEPPSRLKYARSSP